MNIRLAESLNKVFWTTLDWIYPPECIGCGESGYLLCAECQNKIVKRSGYRCKICDTKISREEIICLRCQEQKPSFTALRCLADYEGVIRECIHALKYEKRLGFGWFFSKPLSEIVIKEGWQPDLISPVPLSQERMRERGYNQAAQIAKPLAARLGVQYNPYGLVRIRDTKSQVGLSAGERRINVAGAFEAKTELVFGKKVLIIDDVMTTGATLGACANALKLAGSNEIYCLVLAGFIKRLNANNLNIHQV